MAAAAANRACKMAEVAEGMGRGKRSGFQGPGSIRSVHRPVGQQMFYLLETRSNGGPGSCDRYAGALSHTHIQLRRRSRKPREVFVELLTHWVPPLVQQQ
jgi:hypothetical protein